MIPVDLETLPMVLKFGSRFDSGIDSGCNRRNPGKARDREIT